MGTYLHRTTKQLHVSVSPSGLRDPLASYIESPDLSAVAGQPPKYWVITGDVVTLADQATMDAVDQAITDGARDTVAASMDLPEDFQRAFALALLDQFNVVSAKVNAILDAIDGATSLAEVKAAIAAIPDLNASLTVAQLKTAVRNKLGT